MAGMRERSEKKYVFIIPDGAADLERSDGLSPMAAAKTGRSDWIARNGVCGLLRTQFPELPRGSVVAQLGMLGWDPHVYSTEGRATWELLALDGHGFRKGDLAFRANLVRMAGRRLESYNANHILTCDAKPLVEKINRSLGSRFPDFSLIHGGDFRNTLVVRSAGVGPGRLLCPEPHECEGQEFEVSRLIEGRDPGSAALAQRINDYLARCAELLRCEAANMLFPWSASGLVALPPFHENTGFEGRVGVVAAVSFLEGIAKAGGLEFHKVGNGRPDTDYAAKGARVIDLLEEGFGFVVCHVNGPDEAAHMKDRAAKIASIEEIDRHIVGPVQDYFLRRPGDLGGVMIAPDHYTNLLLEEPVEAVPRREAHSLDPVPFALWTGRERDRVRRFDEDAAARGRYGRDPPSHLDLLALLGLRRGGRSSG